MSEDVHISKCPLTGLDIPCYDGRVVGDDAKLMHVTLRPGHHHQAAEEVHLILIWLVH